MKTDAGGVVNWFVLHNVATDSALAYRIQKTEHSIEIFPQEKLNYNCFRHSSQDLLMNMMVIALLFSMWCHTLCLDTQKDQTGDIIYLIIKTCQNPITQLSVNCLFAFNLTVPFIYTCIPLGKAVLGSESTCFSHHCACGYIDHFSLDLSFLRITAVVCVSISHCGAGGLLVL